MDIASDSDTNLNNIWTVQIVFSPSCKQDKYQ